MLRSGTPDKVFLVKMVNEWLLTPAYVWRAGTALELQVQHGSILYPAGPGTKVGSGDKGDLYQQPFISRCGLPAPLSKKTVTPQDTHMGLEMKSCCPSVEMHFSGSHRDGPGLHQRGSHLSCRWQTERSSPAPAPWPGCFYIP